MCSPGWPITPLLFQLLGSAISSPIFTPTSVPPFLSQISPPFSAVHPSVFSPNIVSPIPNFISNSGESTERSLCPLKVSPSTVVVRFGGPVKANCSIQRMGYSLLGWEVPLKRPEPTAERFLVWSVEKMTNWTIKPMCFALAEQGGPCDIALSLIVYKPPDRVSITFVNHTGPMVEGDQYTLQCKVQEVAPVENLIVTFYRGQSMLAQLHSNSTEKKPVTEIFSLDIFSSKDDNGAQFWCEAKLELGPEGPQHPPVVTSEKLNTTAYFAPQVTCPTKVREGQSLRCEVTGNPQPSVTWFRDGQVVALPSHLSRADAGNYTIQAQGLLRKNFTVEVKVLDVSGTASSCNGHFLWIVLLTQMMNWL